MAQAAAHPIEIRKVTGNEMATAPDLLAVEEPLEIRVRFGPKSDRQERALSVTMRTPGNDLELALGFLFTEGIVSSYSEVENIHHCQEPEKPEERENVVLAELSPNLELDFEKLQRHFYTTSSCGVCSKTSIDAVGVTHCPVLHKGLPTIAASLIPQLPDTLREAQTVFKHTGGIHAAGLFNTSGELLLLREDVGRHNALDKLIGTVLFMEMIPLSDFIVVVSGRASFELVQKSIAAGIPIMAAVGAPSSLAVSLAQTYGMTLLGFVRQGRFNIYTEENRITD